MIVFKEMNNEINVIHLVIGDETEFQLDLSGHVVIPLDDKIDSTKKNLLYINRCPSEEDLQNQIEWYQEKSKNHMFASFLSTPSNDQKTELKNKLNKIVNDKNNKIPEHQKYGVYNNILKCVKCLSTGIYIKNNVPGLCRTCHEIEDGVRNEITPMSKKEKKFFDKLTKENLKNDK